MNVIIANKYKDVLSNLDIDVIKRLDGEFNVETLTDTFANFYFNRMILDITALKDSLNIAVIQRLCSTLDASKIILYLSDDPRFNNSYLSKIISLGIYNFTKDITGINYLMDNPNSYRDVAQYHDLAANDEKSLKAQMQINANQGGFAPNMKTTHVPPQNGQPVFQPFMGPSFNGTMDPAYETPFQGSSAKIIGFKDLTDDAGATSLIYMLKKNLASRNVLAVEVNNNDFSYFNDNELMSVSSSQFGQVRNKFGQFEIILIDINNSNLDTDGTCNEVIYLLEPSTIKLNTLIRRDRQILDKIKDKKVVLNKSLLSTEDVREFEYESKLKIFYNIPPLDERKDSQMVLDSFLERLGIFNDSSSSNGLFNIFKR